MTPYVHSHIFRSFERVVFERAVRAVSYVGEWGTELRCHELARAVCKLLGRNDSVPALTVIDGKLGAMEHSWLQLVISDAEPDGTWNVRRALIDVYTPGRLPQVQLIDPAVLLKHGYVPCELSIVVNHGIVERVYQEMLDGWLGVKQ